MNKAILPALGLAGALVVAACSGDDETASPAPLPPPGVAIVSVQGVGGPVWTPAKQGCVELGHDAEQTVVVTITTSDFVLRPPGTCGSSRQCGTAVLRVDPSGTGEALRIEAAQVAIEAKLATLGAGNRTFRVELENRLGEPVIDQETKAPLFAEITVDVQPVGGCTGASDAGPDADAAAADAMSDAEAGIDAPDDAADAAGASDDASSDAADADAASDAADAGSD